MRNCSGWVSAATLATAIAAASTATAAPRIYDMYLGGFWLGELQVQAEREGQRYRASATLGTRGVLALFYGFAMDAKAVGRVGRHTWRPKRFVAQTRDSRRAQALAMRFNGHRPVSVKATPPFKPKPWQVEPAEQRGATDPLSAFLAAAMTAPGTEPCGREADVFDGRRRHGVMLHAAEPDGTLRRCEALYRRVAGFKPKMMKKPDFPFTVWYAPRHGGGWAFLRAMGETPFGTAVLRRR